MGEFASLGVMETIACLEEANTVVVVLNKNNIEMVGLKIMRDMPFFLDAETIALSFSSQSVEASIDQSKRQLMLAIGTFFGSRLRLYFDACLMGESYFDRRRCLLNNLTVP
jgi:hypothetical protein